VGVNRDGGLEVFTTGTDRGVWHRWWTGGGWSGWHSLGGSFPSRPVAASNQDGRQVVFVRGGSDEVRSNWQEIANANQWSGWKYQGGILRSNPVVGRNLDGRLDVFFYGQDGALLHMRQMVPNSDAWFAEESLPGDELGGFAGDPAVGRDRSGRLHVFASGKDSFMWHIQQSEPNGPWLGWASFGRGWPQPGERVYLAAGLNRDGRQDVFCKGTDGALWHKWQTVADGDWRNWSAWNSLGGKFIGAPAVKATETGSFGVFALGQDGYLWHAWANAARQWSKWDTCGGFRATGEPATSPETNDRVQLFTRGGDKALWYGTQVT